MTQLWEALVLLTLGSLRPRRILRGGHAESYSSRPSELPVLVRRGNVCRGLRYEPTVQFLTNYGERLQHYIGCCRHYPLDWHLPISRAIANAQINSLSFRVLGVEHHPNTTSLQLGGVRACALMVWMLRTIVLSWGKIKSAFPGRVVLAIKRGKIAAAASVFVITISCAKPRFGSS